MGEELTVEAALSFYSGSTQSFLMPVLSQGIPIELLALERAQRVENVNSLLYDFIVELGFKTTLIEPGVISSDHISWKLVE